MPTTIALVPAAAAAPRPRNKAFAFVENPTFVAVAMFVAIALLVTIGLVFSLPLPDDPTALTFAAP